MHKHGTRRITDDLAAHGLVCVVEDICAYNGDPMEVLMLTEEIHIRLGFKK